MKHIDLELFDDPVFWAQKGIINFQPIVNAKSMRIHGVEALSRLPLDSPFSSIFELLDSSHKRNEIHLAERTLLKMAISKFARWELSHRVKLFCNVDNRVFDREEVSPAVIIDHLHESRLPPSNLCIEISERMAPESDEKLARLVALFQRYQVRIAIDDFGRGFSGLETLTLVNPHYLKIDQFFIRDVDADPRKLAIVQNVARMAHSLGLLVVAEGVETHGELRAVRDAGCDFVQGFLIARPTPELAELRPSYKSAEFAHSPRSKVKRRISDLLVKPEPLRSGEPVALAVARYKQGYAIPFIPVVDKQGAIIGAVRETAIRHLIFGDFSNALLRNKGIDQRVDVFLSRMPTGEVSFSPEELVDTYLVSSSDAGLIMTHGERYIGILTNAAMLQLASERAVALARDQNPLTALPGNQSIQSHVGHCIDNQENRTFVFFDFDNFKPFNDKYGFEAGDRALLMFSEQLTKFQHKHRAFVGHVGGDDFFASLPAGEADPQGAIKALVERFRSDVQSLYHHRDKAAGGIWSQDRFGKRRFFPLLRASAAVMPVDFSTCRCGLTGILRQLSAGKSVAKEAASGIHIHRPCSTCTNTADALDAQEAPSDWNTVRNRSGVPCP